jgi:hypothetical protein
MRNTSDKEMNQEEELLLPEQYRILPHSIDLDIPHFHKTCGPRSAAAWKTLAPGPVDCIEWYEEFVDRLLESRGRKYLPVCKIGDGEMLFFVGRQHLDVRWPLRTKLRGFLSSVKWSLLRRGGFSASTENRYSSGEFSYLEWRRFRRQAALDVEAIARQGILAVRLNYGRVYQEQFYEAFGDWLKAHDIVLGETNYYPCYFVYSALAGPTKHALVEGQRVLVVNGATGTRQSRMIQGLKELGAKTVDWLPISSKSSISDKLEISEYIGEVDIAFVGAGLGKFAIMRQLEPLAIPCVDAGFVLDVWADPHKGFERVFCAADEDWDAVGRDPIEENI